MVKLLVLSDDFTGALDTGIQFSKIGAKTQITADWETAFSEMESETDVLVVNTETRHEHHLTAYSVIKTISEQAVRAGVKIIYKKTDSALRGNIGAELGALMAGSGMKSLVFAPAYPKLGRYTEKGYHYIQDKLVGESVFSQDPFEPVTESYVPNIIRAQTEQNVSVCECSQEPEGMTGITVCDAKTDADLQRVAKRICTSDSGFIAAGCAGFAEYLGKELFLGKPRTKELYPIGRNRQILFISGSLNPITTRQLRIAKLMRIPAICVGDDFKTSVVADVENVAQSIMDRLDHGGSLIVETVNSDYLRSTNSAFISRSGESEPKIEGVIARNFGILLKRLLEKGFSGTLVVTGGDTLQGILSVAQSYKINPIMEIEPGVILSEVHLNGRTLYIVTKSGGTGSEQVFWNIRNFILEGRIPELESVANQ